MNYFDSINIKIIKNLDELIHLKDNWTKLLFECDDSNIFLTWEWFYAWWKNLGNEQLYIIVFEENKNIIAIAPLMISTYKIGILKINIFENICSTDCDYSGILIKSSHKKYTNIIYNLLMKIIDNRYFIRFSNIKQCDSIFNDFIRYNKNNYNMNIVKTKKITSCPYVILPADQEIFQNSLPKKLKKNNKLNIKYITSKSQLNFIIYNDINDITLILEKLFILHNDRWIKKGINSKFKNKQYKCFTLDLSQLFFEKGYLHISSINVDKNIASIVVSYMYNKELYYMTPIYDTKFAKYSIGNIHIMKLIEYSIDNNLKIFNFLKGNEKYKMQWTKKISNNYEYYFFKNNFSMKITYYILKMIIFINYIGSRSLLEDIYLLREKIRNMI